MSHLSVKPLVYMRFRPAWAYIEGIRDFGRFFCGRSFTNEAVAERSSVVIQEMLENAVKYSVRDADAEVELALTLSAGGLEISITTVPEPSHLADLRDELATLCARTPEEAYMAAFERATGDDPSRSRLGLARIRYEGDAELSLSEHPDGRITLSARAHV